MDEGGRCPAAPRHARGVPTCVLSTHQALALASPEAEPGGGSFQLWLLTHWTRLGRWAVKGSRVQSARLTGRPKVAPGKCAHPRHNTGPL